MAAASLQNSAAARDLGWGAVLGDRCGRHRPRTAGGLACDEPEAAEASAQDQMSGGGESPGLHGSEAEGRPGKPPATGFARAGTSRIYGSRRPPRISGEAIKQSGPRGGPPTVARGPV